MKNECNIIRDILPLYAENMISEDTASFVEEHLENCCECSDMYNQIKESHIVSEINDEDNTEELTSSLKKIRRKLWKRVGIIAVVICLGVSAIIAALQVFPVYRVFQNDWDNTFTISERKMLAFIGTPSDRKIARSVINQAEVVFSDISHTDEENRDKYGVLGRYAFSSYYFGTYFDAVAEKHSIELLSAHIEEQYGYIFVNYSQEAIAANGETVSGSWNITSLWEIEKDSSGNWTVINIKEHV